MELEDCLRCFEKELSCAICLSLMKDPQSLPCNHQFCRDCVNQAFKNSTYCPLCKLPYSKRSVRRNPSLANIINSFENLRNALESQGVVNLNSPVRVAVPRVTPKKIRLDIIETSYESPVKQKRINSKVDAPIVVYSRRTRSQKTEHQLPVVSQDSDEEEEEEVMDDGIPVHNQESEEGSFESEESEEPSSEEDSEHQVVYDDEEENNAEQESEESSEGSDREQEPIRQLERRSTRTKGKLPKPAHNSTQINSAPSTPSQVSPKTRQTRSPQTLDAESSKSIQNAGSETIKSKRPISTPGVTTRTKERVYILRGTMRRSSENKLS